MQAQRLDSLALPTGDLLDLLRAGQGEDVLDLDTLEWVLDEAAEDMEQQQQQQQQGGGASQHQAAGASGASNAGARLSSATGTTLPQAPPLAPLGVPGDPLGLMAMPAFLSSALRTEQQSSSAADTTTMGTAAAAFNPLGQVLPQHQAMLVSGPLPQQLNAGSHGLLGGANNSSFHSLASSHSQSAAAAAAAAAVAAMQAGKQQQQVLQSLSGGDEGAQSTHRTGPPAVFGGAGGSGGHGHAHKIQRSNDSLNDVTGGQGGVDASGYDHTGGVSAPASKKKRTRNAEQMEQNRQAQQKYRERKKHEHEQLQRALDQMAAQLAALKALEAQAMMLRSQNQQLANTVDEQAARITELSMRVEAQSVELVEARRQAAEASSLSSTQQRMILDQHQKLQLQEEVMTALKGRLQHQMDEAFRGHDKQTVCQRLVAAVRQAIEGASNVENLQESLSQLPDYVVTDICRAILHEVKLMWPELAARFHAVGLGSAPAPAAGCSAEVGCY